MTRNVKKSFPKVTTSHKKRKVREQRAGGTRASSSQQRNESLQARIVKRTEQRDEANRRLNQTRNTLDTLFQANPIPTAITRLKDDVFLNANTAFLTYFDLKLEEVLGRSAQELKLGMELNSHERLQLIDQLQKEGGIRNYERKLLLPSGKLVTILAALQYLCVDDTEAILSAFVDITERKLAEEVLRNMVDAAPDATVVVREDGTIIQVNRQLENVFGHARQDLIGRSLNTLLPERFHELHPQHRLDYFRAPQARALRSGLKLYGRRWDGAEFPVEISLSPLETPDGTFAIAAIRDITKRIETERRIRRLTSLLSEAEQKERQRIAQVLHDDLQQRLFAIKVQLPMLEEVYRGGKWDELQTILAQMDEEVSESIAITRNLSAEFGPTGLQEEDLAGALASLAAQMQKEYGLQVALRTGDIEVNFDSRLSGLLFHMVRELLFNVVKHAETPQATVTLEHVDGEIRITVSDEGRGFDPSNVLSEGGIAHGLLNIRQRLDLLGCRMDITSQLGAGTRIAIYCPSSS